MSDHDPSITGYYIDYPAEPGHFTTSPSDRLHPTLDSALTAAQGIFRDSDLPKVVICAYPSGRRVAGLWGDRAAPETHLR